MAISSEAVTWPVVGFLRVRGAMSRHGYRAMLPVAPPPVYA